MLDNFNSLEDNLLDGVSAIMDTGIKYLAKLINDSIVKPIPVNCGRDSSTPAESCSFILTNCPDSQSGYYHISASNGDSVLMYCELHKTIRGKRGLMRIANVNMTNTSQQCPGSLSLLDTPIRTCQRGITTHGCSLAVFSTNSIRYNTVCGRIRAYQYGTPNAFFWYQTHPDLGLTTYYLDGVSLVNNRSDSTYQHIWSFVGAIDRVDRAMPFACPCTNSHLNYTINIPDFVGDDYFCETGSEEKYIYGKFHIDDPLWDGAGCGENDVCCDRGEYFCKTFSEPTASNIELRLCGNEFQSNEDTPIEIIELYVQ